MRTFSDFMALPRGIRKLMVEVGPPPAGGAPPPPPGGGLGGPPGAPPGGAPLGGGAPPPMGGMGGPPMGGAPGAPGAGGQGPMKLKATNVWDVLEKFLGGGEHHQPQQHPGSQPKNMVK